MDKFYSHSVDAMQAKIREYAPAIEKSHAAEKNGPAREAELVAANALSNAVTRISNLDHGKLKEDSAYRDETRADVALLTGEATSAAGTHAARLNTPAFKRPVDNIASTEIALNFQIKAEEDITVRNGLVALKSYMNELDGQDVAAARPTIVEAVTRAFSDFRQRVSGPSIKTPAEQKTR